MTTRLSATDRQPTPSHRPPETPPLPVRTCGLGDMSAPDNGMHVNDLVQVDPCVVTNSGVVAAALVGTHVCFGQQKISAWSASELVLNPKP